jgi:hypothetical protein
MAGWGDNTFGYLKWGEFGDAYANVTNPNDTQWGKDSYGNFLWGGGGNLDASLGNESVTAEVNVGWSAKTWGYPEGGGWGNLFDVQVSPTGFGLSTNQGDPTITGEINSGYGRLTWGANGWGIQGTLQATGIEMSSDIGSVSIANEINVGWGSDTWGYETWGTSGLVVDLTGIELSSNLGSPTFSITGSTDVSGEEMTATQGDVEAFASFVAEPTGIPLTATLQYQEAIVDPTGQELTANDGTANLDANTIAEVFATSAVTWGNSAWGYGVYGNQQVDTLTMSMQEGDVDPAPDAEVTGIAMAAVLDDVITLGDANTGVITDIAWGEQAWGDSTWGNGKYFDATGYAQAFTISLGTAELEAVTIAAVTGQELTMQEGDETVTGNANILLSGNVLTMASGSLKTLIWNEVNTGTAPIVPPGWQEVDTAA